MSDAAMILMRHYYMLGSTAADALKRIWSTEGQDFVTQFMIYKCYKKFKEAGVPILGHPGNDAPLPSKAGRKRKAKADDTSKTSEPKPKKAPAKKKEPEEPAGDTSNTSEPKSKEEQQHANEEQDEKFVQHVKELIKSTFVPRYDSDKIPSFDELLSMIDIKKEV